MGKSMPKPKSRMTSQKDEIETIDTNGVDDNGVDGQSTPPMNISSTLEELQTDEQRRVLDTVSQVRKCGLESILSLPQIVVCGDQSAGKSSVLEALTEIPFPRNDNLCTRFATEICLRRDPIDSLTIRVIPDSDRPQKEQEEIKDYSESISDFADLPKIMDNAMKVMGITKGGNAFAKDTLSIEICGPNRPQLTLVDIPGLIQTSTKGVSDDDVGLVAAITDHYIKQKRTICLAVISATHDAANQPILQKVRKFDPHGDRTLGVITKPDRLSAGSGSETKFLELARNEDVFFKLGWHVIKNRKFEEMKFSIEQRNLSEKTFFAGSRFNTLSRENLGIDALRIRLSYLLFEHVKNELPRLQKDLESALEDTQNELKTLGDPRSSASECRTYLTKLNMDCYEICRAAIDGNYEAPYFDLDLEDVETLRRTNAEAVVMPLRRVRACLQLYNNNFSKIFEAEGHKYEFGPEDYHFTSKNKASPRFISMREAMIWVRRKLQRARGKELIGNFNPRVIGELFWEQSEPWEKIARAHVEKISKTCEGFLADLLFSMTTRELQRRIWASMVGDFLKTRKQSALQELARLIKDKKKFPINYNHYYTDNVHKKRGKRIEEQIQEHIPESTSGVGTQCSLGPHFPSPLAYRQDLGRTVSRWADSVSADMEEFSCKESLDCLEAIYKVQLKVFIANVVTQVIERHLIDDLQDIFSSMATLNMSDAKIQSMVSEPESTKRQRVFLTDRIAKLEEGQEIFRGVMDP